MITLAAAVVVVFIVLAVVLLFLYFIEKFQKNKIIKVLLLLVQVNIDIEY
jgi:hypothetical protein